ncbi:ABC transporter ATP-binding protein [Pseudohaliea sp.]|uniref:ABC transporter ATP-binding protein n=1 Tax=Pseudohaliea sp. TaxID=2740289 RepID=UPI0032EAC652
MALVKVENVRKRYALGAASVLALDGVSAEVEEGAFAAIAGPSGSGKSTLLNIIGCIDTADEGSVTIDGIDVSGEDPDALADLRARRIGFIFQTFNLLPVLSAQENVEFPLLHLPELSRSERRERAAHYLEVVGLGDRAGSRPNQLSGGQRQRVAIARALATRPRLVLADEPTANLDQATGREILDLMQGINRDTGTTFIFSTHDSQVMAIADRLLHMVDGRLAEASSAEAAS